MLSYAKARLLACLPSRLPHASPRLRADASSIFVLALPLVLSNFAQSGILIVDSMLMGQLGAQALAGGALGLSAFYLCYTLSFGVVSASGNLVALAHGAGRRRDVVAAARAGMLVAVGMALLMGTLLWNVKPLMLLLGQDPAIAETAQGFLRLLVWGMPFGLLFLALRSFSTGVGRPGPVPFITGSALLLSAALGWVLSQWLGVYGVALSSALVYLYMGLSFAWVVARHPSFRRYPLFAGFTRRDLATLRPLWALGLPSAGSLGLESGLFNACTWLMGALGAAQLAAHQGMMQLVIASFMVPLGLLYATSMRVGQAAGAGDHDRVLSLGRTGQGLALAWTALTAVVMLLWGESLIRLFLPDGRPGVEAARAVALTLVPLAALVCMLDGWQSVAGGALRALSDARATMVINALGFWGVGFALAWGLSRGGLGAAGVWMGMAGGLLVTSLLLYFRFERLARRY